MIIRNPINSYPQNITVDPSKASIKFTFMGDRLGSYRLIIGSYSNTAPERVVYDTGAINPSDYIYNNTEIIYEKKLSQMKVFARNSYTWRVEMSPNKSPNNQIEKPIFVSKRYFFQTADTPKITTTPDEDSTAFSINGTTVAYDSNEDLPRIIINDLQNRTLNIEGYYQGNIKYYYFELFDGEDNLIETTPKTFSNKIKYNFSGLLPLKNYTLYCFAVSQNDQYTNVAFDITTTYTSKENINYPPILICNENEANVKIKWLKDFVVTGKATGNYFIEDGKVRIASGEIVYDNISSFPIAMDKNNFAIGLKTIVNENTTKILDYINNDILYEIYVENYIFYLRYGHINSTNKTIRQCGQLRENIVFSIQDYDTAKTDTGYMWYEGEEYSVSDAENKYVLDVGKRSDLYSILLQNNNGNVSCECKPLQKNV